MTFRLLSEEDAASLVKSASYPEEVTLGGEMEDACPDNIVDKVFHPNLKKFSYSPGFKNGENEKTG